MLKTVQRVAGKLESLGDEEKHGVWEKLKSTTVDIFVEARIKLKNLKQAAESAVERVIHLMVIFVLETILLPIFFVWALFTLGRSVFFETPPPHAETRRQAISSSETAISE